MSWPVDEDGQQGCCADPAVEKGQCEQSSPWPWSGSIKRKVGLVEAEKGGVVQCLETLVSVWVLPGG